MVRTFLCILILTTLALPGGEPTPLDGEKKLSAEEANRLLSELPAFKNPRAVQANIVAEVEDLFGSRKEEGTFLLATPSYVKRSFTKPKEKHWLLADKILLEYLPDKKRAFEKDFSGAPKALKRIQSAFMGDFNGLRDLFSISVFSGNTGYRFVLIPSQGESAAGYKRIQAKLLADALFFHEIVYEPESGDKVVERYSNIQALDKVDLEAFKLTLPEDVTRKVDKVSDN